MEVIHDERHDRFVLEHEGTLSMVQYQRQEGGVLHLVRTWVAPEYRGRGFGVLLVRAALDHVREQDLTIRSSCWFVDDFVEQAPEYQDLWA
jgi:predicted GNAT family acetyltransferase